MPGVPPRVRSSHSWPSVGADAVTSLPWQGSADRLVALARARAPELAELVHERFADQIHRVVYRVLGPDSEHEDVVQQAFLEIVRGLHRVRDTERLQAWVRSIAINVARGLIRRRKLRFWLEPRSDALDTWGEPDDTDAKELVHRTYMVLAQLKTDDRIAFSLRYIEGYQVQEVAELTGASLATVHRRLARASREFRQRASRDELLRHRLQQSDIEQEPST